MAVFIPDLDWTALLCTFLLIPSVGVLLALSVVMMGRLPRLVLALWRLWSPPPPRVLLVGFDAGKTTILYRLEKSEAAHRSAERPTIGFGVEAVEHRGLSFTVCELGGQEKIPLWRRYYPNVGALVLVVDSNDRERIGGKVESLSRLDDEEERGTVRQELHAMLREGGLRDIPLLVFANKQDLPHAMSCQEITQRLDLQTIHGRRWFVQGSSALTGDGLSEGVDWLTEAIMHPTQANRDRSNPRSAAPPSALNVAAAGTSRTHLPTRHAYQRLASAYVGVAPSQQPQPQQPDDSILAHSAPAIGLSSTPISRSPSNRLVQQADVGRDRMEAAEAAATAAAEQKEPPAPHVASPIRLPDSDGEFVLIESTDLK